MKNAFTLLIAITFLCIWTQVLEAKTVTGRLKTYKKWSIIDNFVFDESGGKILTEFVDNTATNDTVIVLYSDEEDSWFAVQDVDNDNCIYKVSKSKYVASIRTLDSTTFKVTGARPRNWYVGVANCKGLIDTEYKITFLNNESGTWYKHFGWDEQGMYEMSIVFFLAQFLITCLFTYMFACTVWEKMKKTTSLLWLLASFAEMLGLFFLMLHYSMYSWNGIGSIELEHTYVYMNMLAQMLFLTAIITVIRGWPATISTITGSQAVGMSLFTLNLLSYILLFTWYTADWDHLTTVYMYDSIPGYVVIAVRALTFVWCQYELVRTLKYETEDRRKLFYVIFALFITFWFLYMPVNAIISHFMAPWVRQKSVYAIIFILNTMAYVFPLAIFFPLRVNPFFRLLDEKGKSDAYNPSFNNAKNVLGQA